MINFSQIKKLFYLLMFAGAFALVEAAVVSYLRILLLNDGHNFPMVIIPPDIYYIELWREGATMVMLVTVGTLVGTTLLGRIGSFMFAFGAWDIIYYLCLTFFIGWPSSLLDLDLLFLIAVPWIAPVLAPVLVSIGLIVCGGWLLLFEMEKNHLILSKKDIAIELVAASVILYSFMNNNGNSYPEKFSWTIFLSGLIVGISYFIWRVLTSEKDALRN